MDKWTEYGCAEGQAEESGVNLNEVKDLPLWTGRDRIFQFYKKTERDTYENVTGTTC